MSKNGEIINENEIVLPVPSGHVVAVGIGGKEDDMEKTNYRLKKQTIVTYQYRFLWIFKRYATIIIKTDVFSPNQEFVTASKEEIITEIKRITGHNVIDVLESCIP